MKIIDNFLPNYQFKQLQSLFMESNFPWYNNREIVSGLETDLPLLTHTLFGKREPWNGISSGYFNSMQIFINKLKINELYRIKANLNTGTVFHRHTGWHYDIENVTTAVFYINSNNGYTKFKKGGKVKSVENRMVIFDSNLEHAGFTCTDENVRVVLNFNYTTYPKPRIIK